MKTKHLFLSLLAALLLVSCGGNKTFKVEGILSPEIDGQRISLYNFYENNVVDSAEIVNGAFIFEGEVDTAYLGLMVSDFGLQYPVIIEPGCDLIIDFNEDGLVQGSPLNDDFNDFIKCYELLTQEYAFTADSLQQLLSADVITSEEAVLLLQEESNFISAEMKNNIFQILSEHNNDILGAFAFESYLNMSPDKAEIDSIAATLGNVILENPSVAELMTSINKMSITSEGAMFVDFTIEQEDGTAVSLSDYVGKGQYVLVDFWASWCSPCHAAIPHLKELYNQYNSKGLEILGVAVWDKVDASKQTIEEEQMTWPQILNAQAIPTDLYGITGIPHLILFAPDGTIVTRGTAGEDLYDAIKAVMENKQ